MSDLPVGWEWSTLEGVVDHTIGGVWGKPAGEDEVDVRVLRVTEFKKHTVLNARTGVLRSVSENQLRSRKLEVGDVLLEKSGGGPNTPVGRVVVFRAALQEQAVPTNFVQLLRPNRRVVDASFLAWTLHWWHMSGVAEAHQRATTNIRNLQTKSYLAEPFVVPPLPEQRRIVAAIEEHFSRLDAAEESLSNATRRTQAFVASNVNRAFDDLDERMPLGELAEVNGGIQKQPKRRPTTNKFPFLRVANVKRNQLELDDVHEIELFGDEIDRYRLEKGDLLVVEGNGSPEQIGRSAVWEGEIDHCVHQNHLIRVRPGSDLEPRFLNMFWNSSVNARQLASVASSTSGLYTLSTSKLKRVEIPVTSGPDQLRIADELDAVFEMAGQVQRGLDSAQRRASALRRAILAAAFSGQLVPQDPADEPASLLLERIAAERAASRPSRKRKAAS